MTETLFDRLVGQCGLSPMFARPAMKRALLRAGVTPDALTRSTLRQALPEIRKGLEPFLERETDAALRRLEQL
ncbi:MAG: hypothetical protein WKG00_23575 [Polyangiaceae bacterium]